MTTSEPIPDSQAPIGSAGVIAASSFLDLKVDPALCEILLKQGITVPSAVQTATIPAALSGSDLIVQAQTGSGKTLAFAIPMLAHLERARSERGTFALILTPTRELANQICHVISQLNSQVRPVCLIGGVSMNEQISELDQDNRVIIGTPGRVLDLIEQRCIELRKVAYFVLDEADEMLGMGFLEDVTKILSKLPARRQGLFVSATISARVEMLARKFLQTPKRLEVNSPTSAPTPIDHCYYEVASDVAAKAIALCDFIETERPNSVIVFCNTKSDTELVEVFLRRRGFDARRINSDLTQRQRDYIMTKLRAQELKYLIATDIAARGIDLEQIDVVVNYSLHDQPEIYLHRTGRTGRAGRSGTAVSFIGPQDFGAFRNIQRGLSLDLKKRELPNDQQIANARLEHFEEILTSMGAQPNEREIALAQALMERNQGSNSLAQLVARLYRFTLEHSIEQRRVSLEEEMSAAGDGAARQSVRDNSRQASEDRPERRGDRGRDRGGDRGGRSRRGGGRGR